MQSTVCSTESAHCRTHSKSFACRLAGNNIEKDDRVKAISDGALYLVTDKVSDSTKYCCWSKQYAILSFEVTYSKDFTYRRPKDLMLLQKNSSTTSRTKSLMPVRLDGLLKSTQRYWGWCVTPNITRWETRW